VVECGDLALTKSAWTIKAKSPEGEAVEMEGNGTEVLRRQADGSWRYLIDDPFFAA
jgi:ketosteroid isomerase-like protein